jgi:hypothetical protein
VILIVEVTQKLQLPPAAYQVEESKPRQSEISVYDNQDLLDKYMEWCAKSMVPHDRESFTWMLKHVPTNVKIFSFAVVIHGQSTHFVNFDKG